MRVGDSIKLRLTIDSPTGRRGIKLPPADFKVVLYSKDTNSIALISKDGKQKHIKPPDDFIATAQRVEKTGTETTEGGMGEQHGNTKPQPAKVAKQKIDVRVLARIAKPGNKILTLQCKANIFRIKTPERQEPNIFHPSRVLHCRC